jgi:Ni,Fe-hydrogenase III component G
MKSQVKLALAQAVEEHAGPQGTRWSANADGNLIGWARLEKPESLARAAKALSGAGARLMMITAYRVDKFARVAGLEIAYHFDLEGVALTVTVALDEDGRSVPSITPWFKNADWNEREFSELYGIEATGHPDPRRLFLDKEHDAGILEKMIPLSTMMNGASTSTLWEKVFSGRDMPDWAKGVIN